jgi:glycerophosphoryl diester phosphodiesterase
MRDTAKSGFLPRSSVDARFGTRRVSMTRKTLVIGHRGASREAPENTLASFRLAFEQGADGIEADFRLSADDEIVCLHDDGTGRTAGVDLPVGQSGWQELSRLDVGAWKGEVWRGERMPSLAQVLAALPADKFLYIELKSGEPIIAPLQATLAAAGTAPERIRLLSFSWELVLALKERLPAYRACWLTDYRWRGTWHPSAREVLDTLRRCRADGLASRSRGILDRPFVAALRGEGREIHVWTVDAAAEARRLAELGVDSIMTNRPGWLGQALDRQRPAPGGASS